MHEPKTAAALLARIMPYYISAPAPPEIMTRSEIEAQLKELGLPLDRILLEGTSAARSMRGPRPLGGVASIAHTVTRGELRLFFSFSNMLFTCVDALS